MQSSQNFVRGRLTTLGYGVNKVFMRDAFPTADERAQELTVTTVATGYSFDDGGRSAELGSDLLIRVYSIEFWTFGVTPEFGQNVAHVIREIFEEDFLMPLYDIREVGDPEIDKLQVVEPRGIIVTRQIANDPRPWDMNVWTTTVKVEDYYSPAAWTP